MPLKTKQNGGKTSKRELCTSHACAHVFTPVLPMPTSKSVGGCYLREAVSESVGGGLGFD